MNGAWCSCDDPHLIPVGAISVWLDGTLHSPDVCLVTDVVSALSMAAAS